MLDAEETRLLLVFGNLFSKVSEFNVDALIPDTREAEEEEARSSLRRLLFLCDFRFLPLAPAPFDWVVACEAEEEEESATENGIEEACEDVFFLLFLFPFLEIPQEDETAVEE